MYHLVIGLLVLVAVHLPASEAQARLLGIKIVAPGVEAGDEELRPFNWHSGTILSFYVPSPEGSLIALESDASEVTAASDDTGRDLLAPPAKRDRFEQGAQVGSFPTLAEDGSGALVEISLPRIPAPGATTVSLRAKVVLVAASQREQVMAETSDFSVGSTLVAGPLSFEVSANGKPDWGDLPQQIDLEISGSIDDIANVAISLADGRSLPLTQQGRSSFSGMGMATHTLSYGVPEPVAEGRLVVERWTDRKEHVVVIDREFGIGLDVAE